MATFFPTNSGVDATWLTALHCHSSGSLKKKQKTIKINWALKEKSQNHPGLPWCWAVAFLGCEKPPTIDL